MNKKLHLSVARRPVRHTEIFPEIEDIYPCIMDAKECGMNIDGKLLILPDEISDFLDSGDLNESNIKDIIRDDPFRIKLVKINTQNKSFWFEIHASDSNNDEIMQRYKQLKSIGTIMEVRKHMPTAPASAARIREIEEQRGPGSLW